MDDTPKSPNGNGVKKNALDNSQVYRLVRWVDNNLQDIIQDVENNGLTQEALAKRASQGLGFGVTRCNISGAFGALKVPWPCRAPKPEDSMTAQQIAALNQRQDLIIKQLVELIRRSPFQMPMRNDFQQMAEAGGMLPLFLADTGEDGARG